MNLTEKQMRILQLFSLQGQMGIMRLATLMQCEKALARNMADELVRFGLLVRYDNTQYNISAAGKTKLPEQHAASVAAERKAKKIPSNKTTFDPVADPTPEPEPESEPVKPDDAALDAAVNDDATHHLLQDLAPEPDKPTFDDLVLAGLNRLYDQLRYSPEQIEHKRRKLQTLTKLADTLDGFDKSIAEVLRSVATDLQKLPEVKHG